MPCIHVAIPGGGHAIVKVANQPRKRCHFCPEWSVALCDGLDPSHKSGTCDRRMCEFHRHTVGPNQDLCPDCMKAGKKAVPAAVQNGLFGNQG